MRFLTLYSGSGGNATYIEIGDTALLIDAGKSARRLCSALCEIGSSIEKISAILITHEHSDHVSALETLTKKHRIPIHMPSGCAARFSGERYFALRERAVLHPPISSFEINGLGVTSFPTSHDSYASVGYRIEFLDGDRVRSFGIATDTGYVTKAVQQGLFGCEAVVLESNHDEEMLRCGPYPRDLKQRILSKTGHLSNSDSALFAAHLAKYGTRAFILAHLSEENNTPDTALDTFLSTVADTSVRVAAADPERPTEIEIQELTL